MTGQLFANRSHAATLADSERLIVLHSILSDGLPHTTAELSERTGSMAIHSDVHELRQNGVAVGKARYVGLSQSGRKVYEYQLI